MLFPIVKQDCKTCIVEIIRKKRPTHLKNGKNTKAGIALHRVWKVCAVNYSEEQFTDALNTLIAEQILVAVCHFYRMRRSNALISTGQDYIETIPVEAVTASIRRRWMCDTAGNTIINNDLNDPHLKVNRIVLYVLADGLPEKVIKQCGYPLEQS